MRFYTCSNGEVGWSGHRAGDLIINVVNAPKYYSSEVKYCFAIYSCFD
jgi:hypothetical protein